MEQSWWNQKGFVRLIQSSLQDLSASQMAPYPHMVHYFWPGPKVVHHIRNRMPFETCPKSFWKFLLPLWERLNNEICLYIITVLKNTRWNVYFCHCLMASMILSYEDFFLKEQKSLKWWRIKGHPRSHSFFLFIKHQNVFFKVTPYVKIKLPNKYKYSRDIGFWCSPSLSSLFWEGQKYQTGVKKKSLNSTLFPNVPSVSRSKDPAIPLGSWGSMLSTSTEEKRWFPFPAGGGGP